MNSMCRPPPARLMGLSNVSLGFSTGITPFVVPRLMAAAHVPESQIASITAIAASPDFRSVLFSPILDVRFSRRWCASLLAGLSGCAAATAFLIPHQLLLLQVVLIICNAAAVLSASAPGRLALQYHTESIQKLGEQMAEHCSDQWSRD